MFFWSHLIKKRKNMTLLTSQRAKTIINLYIHNNPNVAYCWSQLYEPRSHKHCLLSMMLLFDFSAVPYPCTPAKYAHTHTHTQTHSHTTLNLKQFSLLSKMHQLCLKETLCRRTHTPLNVVFFQKETHSLHTHTKNIFKKPNFKVASNLGKKMKRRLHFWVRTKMFWYRIFDIDIFVCSGQFFAMFLLLLPFF